MKKLGKTGIANREARKRIAEVAEEKQLNHCEVRFHGCTHNWPLAPAHRHFRSWYKSDMEKLSDYKQWVVACSSCHEKLDGRSTTSQEESDAIFMRLRGSE